jgi:flagellar biosynthesis/type III secretory pathway M-ring protein FliF/YscJ
LVLFIEVAFVILIISLIYRRYIKPFRQAMRSARESVGQRPQGRPMQDPPRQSNINANPQRPIDKSNVQDAEFEDLS